MYLDKGPWWPFYLAVEFFLLAFIWLILSTVKVFLESIFISLILYPLMAGNGFICVLLSSQALGHSWSSIKKIWSLRNEIYFLEKVNISFLPVNKKPVLLDSQLSSVTMILSNSSQEGEIAVTCEALFGGTGSKRKLFKLFFFRTTLFPILSVFWKTFWLGKIYTHIKEDISILTQPTSGSPQIHTVTSFPHKLSYPHPPTYTHFSFLSATALSCPHSVWSLPASWLIKKITLILFRIIMIRANQSLLYRRESMPQDHFSHCLDSALPGCPPNNLDCTHCPVQESCQIQHTGLASSSPHTLCQ